MCQSFDPRHLSLTLKTGGNSEAHSKCHSSGSASSVNSSNQQSGLPVCLYFSCAKTGGIARALALREQRLKRSRENCEQCLKHMTPKHSQLACLVNRDFHLATEGTECSVELLEPSCMVQAKEPINRFTFPVQAPHELGSGNILSHENAVKLDL